MHILGIDPGSRFTGFGIIQINGSHYKHVENGTLYLANTENYSQRLAILYQTLCELIRTFKVTSMAVENIFFHKNVKSTQKLGEVRGVILLVSAQHKLPLLEFSPREVKQAISGYGAAQKTQVTQMVRKLLCLKDIPEENAADALAIALCAAHHSQSKIERLTTHLQNGKTSSQPGSRQSLLAKASFYR